MNRQTALGYSRVVDALARQDAGLYASLCLEAGLVNVRSPEDSFLLQRGLAELKFTQQKLPDEGLYSVKPVWGLFKSDLNVLNYKTLARIFRGVNNLRVPNAMADVMNPDELMAKYAVASSLKAKNKHIGRNDGFFTVIKEMDRIGYPIIFPLVERAKGRNFSAEPGGQLRRLESLPGSIRDEFMSSFMRPYRYSSSQRDIGFDYVDPNQDGKSKVMYINHIFDKLRARQLR
ncbi:MAG: hypothetical protein AABX35_04560 [Nanoarchaeota archaeon]